MIHSLDIGKFVYDRLKHITTNIYPLVAENGTAFPFIIYNRDSLTCKYCKDGIYEDEVILTIKVATATYFGGIEIAQQIREKLYVKDYLCDDMIIDSALDNATEDYVENTYLQTLTFNIKIQNN